MLFRVNCNYGNVAVLENLFVKANETSDLKLGVSQIKQYFAKINWQDISNYPIRRLTTNKFQMILVITTSDLDKGKSICSNTNKIIKL